MNKPAILSSGGPVLQAYWPVLINKGYDIVFIVPQMVENMKSAGYETTWLGNYIEPLPGSGVMQVACRALDDIDWVKAEKSFPPASNADQWFRGVVYSSFSELIPKIAALEGTKQMRKVAGILLHEDVSPDTRLVALWGKANGIPSLHIAHGSYGSTVHKGEQYNIHRQLSCDAICVWNEGQRDFYIRGGAKPEQVFVTGNAWTDELVRIVPDKGHARKMFGLDIERPVVLLQGSFSTNTYYPGKYTEEQNTDMFMRAMKLLPNWQIIIRPHQGTHPYNKGFFMKKLEEHGLHGIIVESNMELSIQAADVIFAAGGSMVCDAAGILERPSVSFRGDGDGFYSVSERDPQKLADTLKLTVGIESTQRWQDAKAIHVFNERWMTDGHAMERTLGVMMKMFAVGEENVSNNSKT